MTKKTVAILPTLTKILIDLGENIHLARLRRNITAEMLAERAGISRNTLREIEQGSATVKMGLYLNVLFCLGLHNDFKNIAANDELGQKIQDIGLVTKNRASRIKKA
jgi:transcriptional regulator with XRE-family HTH domain